MCPGAGKNFSPPSGEGRDDQNGPNEVKLDGQLRHQHDEHGGRAGDHLQGPQGVVLYRRLLNFSCLLANRLSARV